MVKQQMDNKYVISHILSDHRNDVKTLNLFVTPLSLFANGST